MARYNTISTLLLDQQMRLAPQKPWIFQETLDIINLWKNSCLHGDIDQYRHIKAQRNTCIWQDRENFWCIQVTTLETVSQNNNLKQVFNLLRQGRAGPTDSVDQRSLWNILKTYWVPPKITTLLKQLYHQAESCVHVNGKTSEWFPVNRGVRQGCVAMS